MKRLILAVVTLLCSLLIPMSASAAYNPVGAACGSGGGASSSPACNTVTGDPISGPHGALRKASLIIASLAGIAAIIIIIIGGLLFVTSNGDAQKVASARSAVIGALIGLVIIVAAQSILLFVLNRIQ